MATAEAIAALKAMALDSKKRLALAKDSTCMGGLVIVLSNQDHDIVMEALETLLLLSECHEARSILRNHVGMMDQLESIIYNSKKEGRLSSLAGSLYTKLSETSDISSNSLKDISNVSRQSCILKNRNQSNSKDNVKAKSIILQIKGLHDKSDRDLCARLLLKVKGVISITFDLSKKRCILRTKQDLKPEMLTSAIAKSMTMTAQQVIRNENGEETLVILNTSQQVSMPDKENIAELPDYLSDDSDTTFVDEKAVKRPTEEDKKKSFGWFSMATNFLTNSFYW